LVNLILGVVRLNIVAGQPQPESDYSILLPRPVVHIPETFGQQ